MKNLISHNELGAWKMDEKNTDLDNIDNTSEYFQCIVEAGMPDNEAKRFCRHILMT